MTKEFTINGWGTTYTCKFTGNKTDGLRIVCKSDDFDGWWEPFANFTTAKVGSGWAIKDYSENAPWAGNLLVQLEEEGMCEEVGLYPSGFVVMPVVKFTEKFWEEMVA